MKAFLHPGALTWGWVDPFSCLWDSWWRESIPGMLLHFPQGHSPPNQHMLQKMQPRVQSKLLLKPWKRANHLKKKRHNLISFPHGGLRSFYMEKKGKVVFFVSFIQRGKKIFEEFSGMWLLLGFSQLSCFQKHWNVISAIIDQQKQRHWGCSVAQKSWVKIHTLCPETQV